MEILVVLFDLMRQIVWQCFDVWHDALHHEYDLILRLTPTHQRQCDDAQRLMLHHQHRVITGTRNQRAAFAVDRHRQFAEENEDQFNRLTLLLAKNRKRVRYLRFLMPAVRVFQFCWSLFLFSSGVFVLLIISGAFMTDNFASNLSLTY